MTQTSHELANFFVEASKALEELPHVKGKLNEVEESLAICRDVSVGKDNRIDDLMVKQNELEAQIFALKNERDAAEFAALEAKDQAQTLIASIRDVMKGAAAADAILNPTPTPLPSSATSEAGRVGEPGQVSSPEPQQQFSEEGYAGHLQAGSASSSDTPAIHTESHTVTVGSEQRPLDGAGDTTTESMNVSDGHASTTKNVSIESSKPYDGEAYWLKPDSIGWREWVDGGGEAAPYINLDHHSGR